MQGGDDPGCRPALTVCRGAEQRGEERQEQRGRRAHGRRRSAPRTAPLRARRRRRRRPERRPPIPGKAEGGARNAPSAAHTNPRIGGGLSPPPPQPPPAVMLRARHTPSAGDVGMGRGGSARLPLKCPSRLNAPSEALANSRDERWGGLPPPTPRRKSPSEAPSNPAGWEGGLLPATPPPRRNSSSAAPPKAGDEGWGRGIA